MSIEKDKLSYSLEVAVLNYTIFRQHFRNFKCYRDFKFLGISLLCFHDML